MYIAKAKRKENIAEYLLYLWQLEDLLRAIGLDEAGIYDQLVATRKDLDEEQKQQLYFWYIDMVNLLKSEGKTKNGHMEHTLHLIQDLNDLHLRLLKLPVGKEYAELYRTAQPEIEKIRASLGNPDMSDMEVCFRALYAVVLLRLKGGDENGAYIRDVLEVISPLVAKLTQIYHQVERGEIDLFKGAE